MDPAGMAIEVTDNPRDKFAHMYIATIIVSAGCARLPNSQFTSLKTGYRSVSICRKG
jgi:hypothetical protein